MTAREMFEELGYEQTHNNDSFIIYQKNVELANIWFIFNKTIGYFHKVSYIGGNYLIDTYLDIYKNEVKALVKQLEELGWI